MNAPIKDIADYLVAQTSYVLGTDLFLATEPDKPNDCLTLFDAPGLDSDPRFNLESVGVQFRSRATTYQAAYENISAIKVLLEGLRSDIILSGSRYFGFYVTSQPLPLIRDTEEDSILVMTMQIRREPVDAGNRE